MFYIIQIRKLIKPFGRTNGKVPNHLFLYKKDFCPTSKDFWIKC